MISSTKQRSAFGPRQQIDFSALKKGDPGSMLKAHFIDELKDIYWAENHLVKALPKMQKAATTTALKNAFGEHLETTREHVSRLEQVFELLGEKVHAKKCDAMEGILKEGENVIEDTMKDSMTRDVALIIAAQKVEHYEIAAYGSMLQLAVTMNLDDVAELLELTLQEEKLSDVKLTVIAENDINWEASQETVGSLKR